MMDILVATTNKGKVEEIEKLLNDGSLAVKLFSLADFNIDKDCPETGDTFLDNAVEKSLYYSRMVEIYTVADDSGLAVETLDGRPGVHSARYAGEPKDDDRNLDKVLAELKGNPDRNAKFVTVVTLSKGGKEIASFTGEVDGELLTERRGTGGFGYDPIFYYPPFQKTFAELTTEEKNQISHRANAFKKLKEFLAAKDKSVFF